ncbi:hypothetical protein BT93_K1245 [Corymbia citriodora subsp. variegata]|nr:hypothetical protein BT93_K1245 [Corymbia citriodora subsp. variegata]
MKIRPGIFAAIFVSFLVLDSTLLICTAFSVNHEPENTPRNTAPRRLVMFSARNSSSNSAVVNSSKLKGATTMEDQRAGKAVEVSLRRAPQSAPNPTQNK